MIKQYTFEDNLAVKVELMNICNFPIHNHDEFQILYVLEGELILQHIYAKYLLQSGSIHILHSCDVHSITSVTDDNLVLVLTFDVEYFKKVFPEFITTVFITNINETAFQKRDVLRDQIFSIVSEQYNRLPGFASRVNNTAVALINTLMNHYRGFAIDPADKEFTHKTSHDLFQMDRISRIISYVYQNYPYKLSLTEIADKEQINAYYLSHLFHKLVGINFRDFLSMVRVEMSEAQLLSTNKSIAQLADDMGFSDAKYYVKQFRDYFGCHPKEFRKENSSKIYGKCSPDIQEIPLSYLKGIIGHHTQLPVFKEDSMPASIIDLDFKAASVMSAPCFADSSNLVTNIFGDISTRIHFGHNPAELYQDIIPQKQCVKFLTDLMADPERFHIPAFPLFDNESSSNGILTINGLKKPLFYLLRFLEKIPGSVVSYGNNYIITENNQDRYLLAFNPGHTNEATFDVIIKNIPSHYKLTKHHLVASRSCLNYWVQLNFNHKLNAEDFHNINAMTEPEISYEIIPKGRQHHTSVTLEPYDIILFTFISDKDLT